MDILLIDEKIKNDLKNTEELLFYFLESSILLHNYKKILSKPILRSEEIYHKREKNDIIEEYVKIADNYQFDIVEYKSLKKIPLPKIEKLTLPKFETSEELFKMARKLRKVAKLKKPSNKNGIEEEDFKEKYVESIPFLKKYSSIDINKILYYESEKNLPCKNCNGINFFFEDDFIACEDCGYLTERINFINCCSDIKRVNFNKTSKVKKKSL